MKLVIGVHHYPPDHIGGVELVTRRMATWLVARGHEVEVVAVERTDAAEHPTVRTKQVDGVVVHRLGLNLAQAGERLGLRFRDGVLGAWFADYLAGARPDLFHSQSCYLLTASTIDAAAAAGVPTVVSLHDYWFFCPRITLLRSNGERCAEHTQPAECTSCLMGERRRYRLLGAGLKAFAPPGRRLPGQGGLPRWALEGDLLATITDRQAYLGDVLRSVDQVVAPARLIRDLLAADGFSPSEVRLVRPGLDLSRWRGVARAPRPGGLRIGYLGHVAPEKGVHVLIEAFRQLRSPEAPPELMIHGNWTKFPAYAAKLDRLAGGDARIRVRGAFDNDRVEDILAGLDVLVVPSVWFEIGPLVTLEAFAAKVPVVASRLPNMQDQIRDGVDGLLFAPGDASDLTRQLQRLIDEPGLLEGLAGGIAPIRTLDQEMTEIMDLYAAVLGRARPGRSAGGPDVAADG